MLAAQYLMGGQTLGLYIVGWGGIAPQITSLAHHDLTSFSAQYLSAFVCTCLSSSYLMSSGATHGPISLSGPFIPTLAPQNFALSLFGKSGISILGSRTFHTYVISSRVGVFSPAKEYAPDASAFGTPQHLLCTIPYLPRSMVWWRSYGGDFFYGDLSSNFPAYFSHPYIRLLEESECPTFWIFNSQESVWGAFSYFHRLPLAFLLFSKILSSSTL